MTSVLHLQGRGVVRRHALGEKRALCRGLQRRANLTFGKQFSVHRTQPLRRPQQAEPPGGLAPRLLPALLWGELFPLPLS